MFKRFAAWLRAIFNRGMDRLEDPELMLDQARRDMQDTLRQNKEKAVQAITQRNRLQQMMDEAVKKAATLESQATLALKQGNRDLARQFLREKQSSDASIQQLQGTLAAAQETVEQVKVAVKRHEEEVRKKTAEALQMKAQWQQAKIQESITQALQGLTFENEFEGSFAAAREKIQNKQAEAAARTEMFQGSMDGKIMQMQDQSLDMAAEEELQKLEQRLGMQPKVEAPAQVQVTSDVDAQLDELEKRIGQGDAPPTA